MSPHTGSKGPAVSCTLDSPNKWMHYSYGSIPASLFTLYPYVDPILGAVATVATMGAAPESWLGQSGAGFRSQVFGTDYPYAWLDSRISKPPTYFMEGGQPRLIGYSDLAPVDAYSGGRHNPRIQYESQKEWTFDIPATRYRKDQLKVGAGIENGFVHWRSAAVHKTEDQNKNAVALFVMTDTHNGFMFYEVKDYMDVDDAQTSDLDGGPVTSYRNLPPEMWVRVKPEMPAWVSLPDESKEYREKTWLWRFNKDATRAVATPVNSTPAFAYLVLFEYAGKTWARPSLDVEETVLEGAKTAVELYATSNLTPAQFVTLNAALSAVYAAMPRRVGDAGYAGYGHPPYQLTQNCNLLVFKYQGNFYILQTTQMVLSPYYSVTSAVTGFVERVVDVTPGLVEVELSVKTERGDDGKLKITPEVKVVRSDYYDTSGKVYADAAYYVATKRAKKKTNSLDIVNLPADGDLLVADVVVKARPGFNGNDQTIGTVGIDSSIYRAVSTAYGFYCVQNLSKDEPVLTLCLAAQVGMDAGYVGDIATNPRITGIVPTVFIGTLVACELRYLAFITATNYRKQCTTVQLRASEPGGMAFAHLHNVAPRIELRIPGEPLKTVDYGKPSYSGYVPGGLDLSTSKLKPDTVGDGITYLQPAYGGVFNSNLTTGVKAGGLTKYGLGEYGLSDLGADPLRDTSLSVQPPTRYVKDTSTVTTAVRETKTESIGDDANGVPILVTYEGYASVNIMSYDTPALPDLTEQFTSNKAQRKKILQKLLPRVAPSDYNATFTFSPTGDFGVYFDARSEQSAPAATSTETSGMLDVIRIGGHYTSHLKAFNAAFEQDKTYSYMRIHVPEDKYTGSGQFCSMGLFAYNIPQPKLKKTDGAVLKPT